MRPTSDYNKILTTLKDLHKQCPLCNMGKHLATALDGYMDLWSLSDAEMLNLLKKYSENLEYDIPHKEDDVETIIKEGLNLNKLREELLSEEE
jgi:hypothetical protein